MVNNCSACHSLDYITTQPRGKGEQFWRDSVAKMVNVYKAPLSPEDADAVGAALGAQVRLINERSGAPPKRSSAQAEPGWERSLAQSQAAGFGRDRSCSARDHRPVGGHADRAAAERAVVLDADPLAVLVAQLARAG